MVLPTYIGNMQHPFLFVLAIAFQMEFILHAYSAFCICHQLELPGGGGGGVCS